MPGPRSDPGLPAPAEHERPDGFPGQASALRDPGMHSPSRVDVVVAGLSRALSGAGGGTGFLGRAEASGAPGCPPVEAPEALRSGAQTLPTQKTSI
jgi:hypothetical protein